MNRIKGMNAIITGASSGIGMACAELFASQRANLFLVARRLDRLQDLKTKLQKQYTVSVDIRKLDVRNRDDVRAFAQELQQSSYIVDILINNAGLSSGLANLHEGDFEDWDRMIETNIKGLLNVSRCIIPLMVKSQGGHIVNLGSIAGYQVYPGGNVYNATKYATRALSQAMNIDLLGTEIRVSCISPGAVQTEFSEVRFHGDKQRAEQVYVGYTPLQAQDIAEAILFVINAPQHVNIQEMIIMPTAQRSVNHWHRETNR